MISPIAIATRGRISVSTKKTLTLSTIGRIVIMGTVIEEPAPRLPETKPNSGYGGIRIIDKDEKIKDRNWIILEDREIIAIVQFTIKTVII